MPPLTLVPVLDNNDNQDAVIAAFTSGFPFRIVTPGQNFGQIIHGYLDAPSNCQLLILFNFTALALPKQVVTSTVTTAILVRDGKKVA